jgi:hypothetical protein
VNADEYHLGQVFRFGKIVQHAEHEADDGLFVFFDQLLKGAHVSVFGEEHERGIWVGRIGHQCKVNLTPGGRQGCGANHSELTLPLDWSEMGLMKPQLSFCGGVRPVEVI